jgi:hypothetical protein
MIGLPSSDYHLEFTSHISGSPCPAPTKDNLLVFNFVSLESITENVKRLKKLGYNPVEPENPYWKEKGVSFEDPDGWRVVLFNHNFDP